LQKHFLIPATLNQIVKVAGKVLISKRSPSECEIFISTHNVTQHLSDVFARAQLPHVLAQTCESGGSTPLLYIHLMATLHSMNTPTKTTALESRLLQNGAFECSCVR
jgi:hypothetical protein